LTLTPNELATMAKQRYMIMKTKGTLSNSIKSRNEEMIELWAELNQSVNAPVKGALLLICTMNGNPIAHTRVSYSRCI
jgi:hypothetical protein